MNTPPSDPISPKLPLFPEGLWPTLPPSSCIRQPDQSASLQIPSQAENSLLTKLHQGIAADMKSAGLWSARAAARRESDPKTAQQNDAYAWQKAMDAVHLHQVYHGLFLASPRRDPLLPTPQEVRQIAIESWQYAFRYERGRLAPSPFRDGPAQTAKRRGRHL